MAKNFYWLTSPYEGHENEERDSIYVHIGKMAVAGKYCYDCGTTYHIEGTKANAIRSGSFEKCPFCGKPRKQATNAYKFTWTVMKHKEALEGFVRINSPIKIVLDEENNGYTAKEFLGLVEKNCPIQAQLPRKFS